MKNIFFIYLKIKERLPMKLDIKNLKKIILVIIGSISFLVGIKCLQILTEFAPIIPLWLALIILFVFFFGLFIIYMVASEFRKDQRRQKIRKEIYEKIQKNRTYESIEYERICKKYDKTLK